MLVIVCYIFYNDVTSSQSSLHVAVGPDTRKGCHYISVSKTYLDLLLVCLQAY